MFAPLGTLLLQVPGKRGEVDAKPIYAWPYWWANGSYSQSVSQSVSQVSASQLGTLALSERGIGMGMGLHTFTFTL